MRLWDYVDERGVNRFKAWTDGLDREEQARLRAKLALLAGITDPSLLSSFLFMVERKYPEIRKLKVGAQGSKTALRPMVCRGPIDKNGEITLLLGAKEAGGKLPPGAAAKADENRQAVLINSARRCEHVRV